MMVNKEVDVVTLGNLCVDMVVRVPKLPSQSPEERKAYLDKLSNSPPDQQYWEAGGICNIAIAAVRLGLQCKIIGRAGDEIYGHFLSDVLRDEGISMVGMNEQDHVAISSNTLCETLCWVLVDPSQQHDFLWYSPLKEAVFSGMFKLSTEVMTVIKQSKILFCECYIFDSLPPDPIILVLDYAFEVGTCIFFDPTPYAKTLANGTPNERKSLEKVLRMTDVLLLTSDEAESLTGIEDPVVAGKELLRKGIHSKWVIIKMGSKGSILVTVSSITYAPAFKVNVSNTVGCGDSFAAAVAYGYIHSLPLVHTLTIANAVGAATATSSGAGRAVATLEKVVEIMTKSNLNEDANFLKELLDKDLDGKEITSLSNMITSGSHNQMNHVPLQTVVSEMLPKLDSGWSKGIAPIS